MQGGKGTFGGDATAIANSTYQNNIDADPLFGNPFSGLAYDLKPGSPCINAGTSSGAPLTDIVGRSRPSGSGVDIGAYEQNDDASLPVELSVFSGTITQDGVLLQWQTRSETNNLGFHVYRSRTKDDDYVRITSTLIKGHGTDSTPHDYSFLDETAEEGQIYWYLIEDVDYAGVTERSNPIQLIFRRQAVPLKVLPTRFALYQNYPNPFNPETWMPYDLAADADVVITIYNARGQRIRTLALGRQTTGAYRSKESAAYWDGRSEIGEWVSSGLYFYHIRAGDFTAAKRMVILK
ncbi:T9SS type A sorting domain-containing protein [Candidatus Poribacteria bacterium]|nr:T9SS type A sorting domain-containing protein [Candidatus Poribacteria bacterium]